MISVCAALGQYQNRGFADASLAQGEKRGGVFGAPVMLPRNGGARGVPTRMEGVECAGGGAG